MEFNSVESRQAPRGAHKRRRLQRWLLLLLEVAALAGLLAGVVHLWRVRQTLQEDLIVAQEVEAVIRDGAVIPGFGGEQQTSYSSRVAAGAAAYGVDVPGIGFEDRTREGGLFAQFFSMWSGR